ATRLASRLDGDKKKAAPRRGSGGGSRPRGCDTSLLLSAFQPPTHVIPATSNHPRALPHSQSKSMVPFAFHKCKLPPGTCGGFLGEDRREVPSGRDRRSALGLRRSGLQAANAGQMNFSRQTAADDALSDLSSFDQAFEIDARGDAHSVEHVHEIFGREVSRSTGCIRTPAHAAYARVEVTDAHLEADEHVRERAAACVVYVHREPGRRDLAEHALEDPRGVPRRSDADRV